MFIPGGICFKTNKNEIFNSGETSQPLDFEWELSKYYDQIEIQNYYKYGGLGAFSKFVESYAGKVLPYGAVLTKEDVYIFAFELQGLLMAKG